MRVASLDGLGPDFLLDVAVTMPGCFDGSDLLLGMPGDK